MAIKTGRLNRLEQKMKPLEDEIERKKKELKSKEEMFCSLNQVMKEHFPRHEWCKLTNRERLRIYNNPEPTGTYKKTDSPLPIFVPSIKKEHRLLIEVHRLYADIIKAEILRRREQTRGKINNN